MLYEVITVAQGHVWTGQDALRLGLVDELGSLEDAIHSAGELANLSSYQVSPIEPPLSPSVITSYSIHYTKLYEIWPWPGQRAGPG